MTSTRTSISPKVGPWLVTGEGSSPPHWQPSGIAPMLPGIDGRQLLTLAWGRPRPRFPVPGWCRGDLHLRLCGGWHDVQPSWLRL